MHNEAWTPEIDAAVTRMRRDERLAAKVIAARVGRTPGAVSARLLKLGVTIHARAEWTDGDVARLTSLVSDQARSIRGIAREMGRTECSVRWKIDDLGLKPGRLRPWTAEDDASALSASGAPEATRRAVAEGLGRSYEAFQARLVHLGVRRKRTWDAGSLARLAELSGEGASVERAAADLDRDVGAVRSKGYALGMRFRASDDARLPWSAADDARLSALAERLGTGKRAVAAMSAELGRSERSVRVRLRRIGRASGRQRRPLDQTAREAILAAARSGMALGAAASSLGRDARTLKAVAADAGVTFVRVARVPPARSPSHGGASRAAASRGAGVIHVVASALPSARREQERRHAEAMHRAGMEDAIARFVRERGVTRAERDPAEETVRLVRSRGYSVVGAPDDGYLVDGRHRLVDVPALLAFARDRGIPTPAASALAG